jgi:hypothetical protein
MRDGKEENGIGVHSPQIRSLGNSPELESQTTEVQYIGSVSGVSFLLRVQRKLLIKSPGHLNSSIFNFGDRPLPSLDASFVILPLNTNLVPPCHQRTTLAELRG